MPQSSPGAVGSGGREHVFVAPDLHGPETGGTLYNAQLIAALRDAGAACRQLDLAQALAGGDALAHAGQVWVDSLYLEAMPELSLRAPAAFLILHYLPSLVSRGRIVRWQELTPIERLAIERAGGFLVTSRFMAGQLQRFPIGRRAQLCVEPGVALPDSIEQRAASEPRALVLCNVVEAKGVLPLLQALARLAHEDDVFSLSIAGSLDAEPGYAQACARVCAEHPSLRTRVTLHGALRHRDAMRLLQRCDALLSASRMESYGMALAEARAIGIPIVARAGGHSEQLVNERSGGCLVASEHEVAAQWLALVRDPVRRAALSQRARSARSTRTWQQAASELSAQLAALG